MQSRRPYSGVKKIIDKNFHIFSIFLMVQGICGLTLGTTFRKTQDGFPDRAKLVKREM